LNDTIYLGPLPEQSIEQSSIRYTAFTTVRFELGHESPVSLQTVDSRGGGSDESRGDETSRTSQCTRGS
jgi:hypothetical protein